MFPLDSAGQESRGGEYACRGEETNLVKGRKAGGVWGVNLLCVHGPNSLKIQGFITIKTTLVHLLFCNFKLVFQA